MTIVPKRMTMKNINLTSDVAKEELSEVERFGDNDDFTASNQPATEGWTELMGSDIMLKIISSSSKETSNDVAASPMEVQPHDAVRVSFVGRLADSLLEASAFDGPIFHQAQDWLVVVAEKDVSPCLELAVRFMSVGEMALVWSRSKFAYGASQRQHGDFVLPPHANVCYQVFVQSVVASDEREAPAFAYQAAMAKKLIANDVYANEVWSTASVDGLASTKSRCLYLYSRALTYCDQILSRAGNSQEGEDDDTDMNEDDMDESTLALRQKAIVAYTDCLNNMTAVHLRTKDYKQAKATAIRVLSKAPNNAKALVRVAKASLHDPASDFVEVEAAIDAAHEVLTDGTSASADGEQDLLRKDLQSVRVELERKKREYKQKSKAMASKMSKALRNGAVAGDSNSGDGVNRDSIKLEQTTENFDTQDENAATEEADSNDLDATLDRLKELKDSIIANENLVYDVPNWKLQLRQTVLQVLLPIAVYWLIRYFQRTSASSTSSESA
ncbi:peptidyl-prolyl cis-trans isomerase fkbp8 [Mayamaea pseudoterrestris]|nr:peptidyl-prolyl cis-trans isomerase fkbp8 [Mayamaea pseudoterrestris]